MQRPRLDKRSSPSPLGRPLTSSSPISPRRGYFSQTNTWSTFGLGERSLSKEVQLMSREGPGPAKYSTSISDFNTPKYDPNSNRYSSPYSKKKEVLLKQSKIQFERPPPVSTPPRSPRFSSAQSNISISTGLTPSQSLDTNTSKTTNSLAVKESVKEMSKLIQQYHKILSEASATRNARHHSETESFTLSSSKTESSRENNQKGEITLSPRRTSTSSGVTTPILSPRQSQSPRCFDRSSPSVLSPRRSPRVTSPFTSTPDLCNVRYKSPVSERVHLLNRVQRSGSSYPLNSTSSRFLSPSRVSHPGPADYNLTDVDVMLSKRTR